MLGDHAAQPDPFAEALDRVRRAAGLLDPSAGDRVPVQREPTSVDENAYAGAVVPERDAEASPVDGEQGVVWSGSAVRAAAAAMELKDRGEASSGDAGQGVTWSGSAVHAAAAAMELSR